MTSFGLRLEDLFGHEAYRGRGIGFGLFSRLYAATRDRDCRRIEWSVLNWNGRALRFSDRIGAFRLSERRLMRIEAPTIIDPAAETAGPGSDSIP